MERYQFVRRISPGVFVYCKGRSLQGMVKSFAYKSRGSCHDVDDVALATGVMVAFPENLGALEYVSVENLEHDTRWRA